MLQMPTIQMTNLSAIYVEDPDIPAGITIAAYRVARPHRLAWWRRRRS